MVGSKGFKLAPGYVQTDWWLQGGTIATNEQVLIDMQWPPNGKFSWESFLVCFTRNQTYNDIRLLRPFWASPEKRKCIVDPLTLQEDKRFLDQHHIAMQRYMVNLNP